MEHEQCHYGSNAFALNVDIHVYCRLQEKYVKEKQVEYQKNIIDLQEKLKKNQEKVRNQLETTEHPAFRLPDKCLLCVNYVLLVFPR